MTRTGVSVLAVLALVVGALTLPAAAHADVGLEVGPNPVPVDGTLEVSGTGCAALAEVELYFWQTSGGPYIYEYTTADADGDFVFSLALAERWPHGVQIGVSAGCGGSTIIKFVDTEQPPEIVVSVSFTRSVQRYGRSERATVSFEPSTTLGFVSLAVDGKALTATPRADAGWGDPVDYALPANLRVGKRTLVAAFRPSAPGAAPVTKTVGYTVKKAVPRVSVGLSKKRVRAGAKAKATVRVTATGIPRPGGKVAIKRGKTTVKTVTLRSAHRGKVVVTLPAVRKAGEYRISASYLGSSTIEKKRSSAKSLRVVRR
ncbi:Ig-like domain repeat protein [Leucobacter weissii]|uniref:Ig-like domain repeat protein n=1 Tax=Leucobacter weissii TaxID=1983706 RepID=A0A939SCZ2_9MICO|nr:Ig-like domain-containing protein [Leucobacter weissii]MBO1902848.1 Ig-like domain repeat protein [Leucobacter weissii]